MVVGGMRPAGNQFPPVASAPPHCSGLRHGARCRAAVGRRWEHDDRAVQPHFHLQIALRSAVVGARSGRVGDEV